MCVITVVLSVNKMGTEKHSVFLTPLDQFMQACQSVQRVFTLARLAC